MRFSPLSFVLGLAAASIVPVMARVFRPFAVEATAAGLGMLEDARRIVAEQMESFEDVLAEARARREHLDIEDTAASLDDVAEASDDSPAPAARGRRRTANAARQRS
jgi:hypothetical protein